MNAKELSILSNKAHYNPPINADQFSDPDSETEGYFLEKDDSLIIVFQGSSIITKDETDWIQNLSFLKKEIKFFDTKIKLHSGIWYKYFNWIDHYIKTQLTYKYKYNLNTIKNITITGFSQGGALATICALSLREFLNTNYIINCYTFGSLRIFNPQGAKLFNTKKINSYRYVYADDIVPRLPFWWLNYKHVGGLIKLGKSKFPFNIFGSFTDHKNSEYTKRL